MPDRTLVPPPGTVDVMFTPGAMKATASPRLENDATASFLSLAATAMTPG